MKQNRKFFRQCVCCKEYKNKEDLIRITKEYKTKEIRINNDNSICGRSVYICKNSQCIEKAFKKKRIEASLKSDLPDKIKENIYNLLKN